MVARLRKEIIANPEAERAVLGGIFIDPQWARQVAEILEPGDFYEPKHQVIFRAVVDLIEADKPVDVIAVNEQLSQDRALKEAGHTSYTHSLANEVPTARRTMEYARTVLGLSLDRQTQAIGSNITSYEVSAEEGVRRLQEIERRRKHGEGVADELPGMLLSDVTSQPVRWVWTNRAAFGKSTIIDGNGGEGKGLCSIDLVARWTTGRPLPGESTAEDPFNVIMVTPEDDPADTIKPRLELAGADCTRVRFLVTVSDIHPKTGRKTERLLTIPRDVPILEEVIKRDKARALIIDPIMACLDPGVKTGIDADVRTALMPLKQMVERTGVVLIMVRHLNKSGGENAAYRGGGSVAFTNLARFVFLLAPDPDDNKHKVLARAKSNYKDAPSLAFTIEDCNGHPRIRWDEEPSDYDANTLLSVRKSQESADIILALKQAAKACDLREIMDLLPDERKPTDAALRQRCSRMAARNAITRVSDGMYAHNTLSQVSHTVTLSQVSQVSQNGNLHNSRPVTVVTDVTGGYGVTGDYEIPRQSPPVTPCPKCGKRLWARRLDGHGWGCRQCERREVL